MQDRVERTALLKKIEESLAEIKKIEEAAAKIRLELSNASKLFLINRNQVSNLRLIAFRQHLGRLSDSYLDLEAKTYDIMQIVDKIQP
jgi:hypothetical protein